MLADSVTLCRADATAQYHSPQLGLLQLRPEMRPSEIGARNWL